VKEHLCSAQQRNDLALEQTHPISEWVIFGCSLRNHGVSPGLPTQVRRLKPPRPLRRGRVRTLSGETGDLVLEGGAPRGFQSGRLRLLVDGAPVPVNEGEAAPMPDEAANVALVYAALCDDGTATTTGFDHAVRVAKLVEDLLASSRTGARMTAAGWPEQQ